MRRLEGRTALVTGGSRGLGAAIARRFGREGCAVAVGCRTETEAARAVTADVEATSGKAVLALGDLRDEATAEAVVRQSAETLGGLDILVNNAGIWRGGRLRDAQLSDWRDIWETNILGTMQVTRAALPYLEASQRGRIIVMSSIIGIGGFPGDTAYASTKAGLVGFTRALAKELAKKAITVNAVAPGYIDVGVTAEVPQKGRDMMLERIPMGRPGTANEVAALVAFLAAEGDYVTGQVLAIAGGMEL